MRGQQQLPEDPTAHFMDYVGHQRSPLWDEMESMSDENEKIGEELPNFEADLVRLTAQLEEAKRKTRMIECYKLADPENTVSIQIDN